jgi:hypothetical protein
MYLGYVIQSNTLQSHGFQSYHPPPYYLALFLQGDLKKASPIDKSDSAAHSWQTWATATYLALLETHFLNIFLGGVPPWHSSCKRKFFFNLI